LPTFFPLPLDNWFCCT